MATTVDAAAAAAAAHGMTIDRTAYEAMERDLYASVECRLEENGTMAALKAQLRADIFATMVEEPAAGQPSAAQRCRNLPNGAAALGLVVDFLAALGLSKALCVLAPDLGIEDAEAHPDALLTPETRGKLRAAVGLPPVPSKIPVLCELLEHRKMAPEPKLDPALSLSSSMPVPASTHAKLQAAKAAALASVIAAEDSYSHSASFEDASVSPRASYGEASFEAESPRTLSPRVSPSPSPEPGRIEAAPRFAPLRPRLDSGSDGPIEDEVEVASASEDSMFAPPGGGGDAGGDAGSDVDAGGGADVDADAGEAGADAYAGGAGADADAGGGADADADAAPESAADAAPLRPRADRGAAGAGSASASDDSSGGSSGDVSFAEDSAGEDDAPAPSRPDPGALLASGDPARPRPPPPRRAFSPRPSAASFPGLPGMVAAPAADDPEPGPGVSGPEGG